MEGIFCGSLLNRVAQNTGVGPCSRFNTVCFLFVLFYVLCIVQARQSRYRTACHGHVSLYVTAKNRRAGKIKHNKTLSGLRVVGLIRLVFFCFVLRFVFCATLLYILMYSKLK